MDFTSLYNKEKEFNIVFSSPVEELRTFDTVSFPGPNSWNRSHIDNITRVTPTFYIIECDDCIIRLESDTDQVYVLIHGKDDIEEYNMLIMYRGKPITDVVNKYPDGIKHLF